MTVSSDTDTYPGYEKLKELGNAAFKDGKWTEAINRYNEGLKSTSLDSREAAILFKNAAAAYLKLEDYNSALKACDSSLAVVEDDPKTLYRRSQALEKLGRIEESYNDLRKIHKLDPGNKAIQPDLARLHAAVEEKATLNRSTDSKVQQMFKYAFDIGEDMEKRTKACTNLLVLSKEIYGSDALMKAGVIEKIFKLLKVEKNREIVIGCIRVIGQLCKMKVDHTKKIISTLGIPWFLDMVNSRDEEHVNASQYCLQSLLNSLTGIDTNKEEKPVPDLLKENKAEIDTMLTCLIYGSTSRTITGLSRDAIVQLISRNVHYQAIDWANELIKIKGLQRLMEVASELKEYKYESAMEITDSTQALTSVCLARIYENMYSDESRAKYLENIDDFIKGKLITPELEPKVRVVVALTALLLGPIDIGNAVISRDGIMEMILAMASSDDVLQQKVACECLIAAATKKDKVKSIIAQGVVILKKLYQSKDDSIRVRALVGLCKLGSSGGTDASIRPFAEGATARLCEACKKFLINPKKDTDMRRWAAEGLSYLTLDAEVKEKLVNDQDALRALFDLAKSGNQNAVYGVITTFINLINAYDKQEVLPELVELAKFSKQHIPEDHELDDPDFVSQRCCILVKEGVVSALVALVKSESINCREMIARVFCTLSSQQDLRGIMVQQGAVKALLELTKNGTDKGMRQASQALARIGISIDPAVAFSGQKNMDLVKPLLRLLEPDCNALENFEALLAICNLASMGESVRNHIVKQQGLSKIENCMYEEHEMIRRAATQVMTNLILNERVVELYNGENDRTKFLFLLCGEEDEETAKAAAGALAMLTSVSTKSCAKIFSASSWLETLHMGLGHPNLEIQHRILVVITNVISADKELAEKIIETDIMEILMALTLLNEPEKKKNSELAQKALDAAKKWKIIKTTDELRKEIATQIDNENEVKEDE